jgi:hypothetical protein
MARPTKADRTQVAETTLTLRLTEPQREALDQLVAMRAAELADEGVTITAASLVRGLILREAKAKGVAVGVAVGEANTGAPAKVATITTKKADKTTTTKVADSATLLQRVESLIAKGYSAAEIARAAKIDGGHLSRFRKQGTGLSAEREAQLDQATQKMLRE